MLVEHLVGGFIFWVLSTLPVTPPVLPALERDVFKGFAPGNTYKPVRTVESQVSHPRVRICTLMGTPWPRPCPRDSCTHSSLKITSIKPAWWILQILTACWTRGGEPAFWVYNCLQKGRKDEAPTRLLVLGNWQQFLDTWPRTEYLLQGPKAHSRHGQARGNHFCATQQEFGTSQGPLLFFLYVSIKNVAKASQNLKLQLIA